MLLELRVKNFALFDDIRVTFRPGFTAITGETGSGKSLLVNSLILLLGKRAESHWVRSGEEKALVEGVFSVEEKGCLPLRLEEAGFPKEEGLILRRLIFPDGRGRAYLNDSPITLRLLQNILSGLVEIQGQRESLQLLNPARHLALLDAFARLAPLKDEYLQAYGRYRALVKEKEEEERGREERLRRIDYLSYQIREIEDAHLIPGEEEELRGRRDLLRHAEKLKDALHKGVHLLEEASPSVCSMLRELISSLNPFSSLTSSLKEEMEKLEEALTLLEEGSIALERFSSALDTDPAELEKVEERLDLLHRLKSKYGSSVDEILEYLKETKGEHEALSDIEERRRGLDEEIAIAFSEVKELGERLSKERQKKAIEFERQTENILNELSMQGCRPIVQFHKRETPGPNGIEEVEFLIRPNPGEESRPLRKIASGGELSRITLAIRSVLSDIEKTPILVLDEIDSGIGGVTAQQVGQLLRRLGKDRQIICITHLPQVASHAHHQLAVEKEVEGGRTVTNIRELTEPERQKELLRMMGGDYPVRGKS